MAPPSSIPPHPAFGIVIFGLVKKGNDGGAMITKSGEKKKMLPPEFMPEFHTDEGKKAFCIPKIENLVAFLHLLRYNAGEKRLF